MNSHRQYIPCFRVLAIVIPLQTPVAWAGGSSSIPAYQAGTGVLSYTFFNLTGNSCSMSSYGGGPNPAAYSGWAQSNGWDNWGDSANPQAGFFNTYGLPSSQVTNNFIFYNNGDPIASITTPTNPFILGSGQGGPSNGVVVTSSLLEPSSSNESINYPAMGDSWSISCSSSLPPIAVANLASAASALQSGGGTAYPYNNEFYVGLFGNASIQPTEWAGCDSWSNPCGVGFTDIPLNPFGSPNLGNLNMNWNVAPSAPNYQAMGGLWTGIYYNTPSCGTGSYTSCNPYNSYPGSSLFNLSMLPINLSAYVQANQNQSQSMSFTPIYGGVFTVAMGDPFIVSSYAAKMLWFLVSSSNYTLNNDTTLGDMATNLSSAQAGVFEPGSFESNYVQWLVGSSVSPETYPGSPQLAANAYYNAYKAASTAITKESVWGKVFTGLADTAIDIAIAATAALPGGDVVEAVAGGVAAAVGGAIVPDMNAAITNGFTTTISGPAPLSQNAPALINPTYAATNLFGLLLTNSGVQETINKTMQTNYPDFNDNPNPYWSNYSIYTDYIAYQTGQTTIPSGCVTTASGVSISLANNLLSGNCYNSSGTLVYNNGNLPEDTYTNVYSSNQTSAAFSIWNSILTGSDITTNSNGYIVSGNSAGNIPSFSPPIQLINATNGGASPINPLSEGIAVNTTFSLNSGTVTAATMVGLWDPTTPGTYPAPAATPQYLSEDGSYYFPTSGAYAPTYNATTGVFTVNGYCDPSSLTCTSSDFTPFANAPVSINMTGCIPGSSVVINIPTIDTVSLACQFADELDNVILDYSSCTSDPWATGGVLSAVITAPNTNTGLGGNATLACACVPSYLDGPGIGAASANQLLGGVVVGATSQYPNQKCPLPQN